MQRPARAAAAAGAVQRRPRADRAEPPPAGGRHDGADADSLIRARRVGQNRLRFGRGHDAAHKFAVQRLRRAVILALIGQEEGRTGADARGEGAPGCGVAARKIVAHFASVSSIARLAPSLVSPASALASWIDFVDPSRFALGPSRPSRFGLRRRPTLAADPASAIENRPAANGVSPDPF